MTHPGPPPPFPDPAAGEGSGVPGSTPPGPATSWSAPGQSYPGEQPYGEQPHEEHPRGAQPYTQAYGDPAPAEQLFGEQPHGPQFAQPPTAWSQPQSGHAADQPFDPSIPSYTLSSDQFRPPKDRKPLWIVGIVVAVVALVVATSSIVAWRSDQQQQQATAPPSAPATIPTPSGNGIDFDYSDGAGRMEIVNSRWTSDRLEVQVRITVTRGEVQYGLYNFTAFDEQGTTIDPSTSDVPVPALGEGTVTPGQTTEGWLALQVQRQDVTLLLVSQYGKAITAYLIEG